MPGINFLLKYFSTLCSALRGTGRMTRVCYALHLTSL